MRERRTSMGASRSAVAAGALTIGIAAVSLVAGAVGWSASGAFEAGVAARVSGGLQAAGQSWAEAHVDGARVRLTGLAPDPEAAADAVRAVALAAGPLAVVEDAVETAPPAHRPASATAAPPDMALEILRDADGATILGVAPSAEALGDVVARLTRLTGAPVDASMARTLEDGAPWRRWADIVQEGVAAAAALPLGRVKLAPGRLIFCAPARAPGFGVAESEPNSEIDAALARLREAGVEVVVEAGEPSAAPRVALAGPAPREPVHGAVPKPGAPWLAVSAHRGGVALSGAAPDSASRVAIASYAAAAFAGRSVDADGLTSPEDGADPAVAPEGWRAAALAALDALSQLDGGAARVSDGAVSLRGRTLDAAEVREADRALAALRQRGWTVATRVTVDLAARAAAMRLGPALCASALSAQVAAEPIRFEPGESVLGPEASASLDALAAVLRRCEGGTVEIGGHTDSQGSAEYNLALSAARARAVAEALAERVALRVALTARGYGPERPIADNATEQGRAMNRRIAFTAPRAGEGADATPPEIVAEENRP